MKITLAANTYGAGGLGGHISVYLNWALGLRAAGCEVFWLEFTRDEDAQAVAANIARLHDVLQPHGLDQALAIASSTGRRLAEAEVGLVPLESLDDSDLVIAMGYTPRRMLPRARRSALIDLDPGLTQVWVSKGWVQIDGYDSYFTTGETVGSPAARFPDAGIRWLHTRPCVSLDWWEPQPAAPGAAFTTVSNWRTGDEWMQDADGSWYSNDKRDGFLPFLDLPRRTSQPLELALSIDPRAEDRDELERYGWRVVLAWEVAGSPAAYQAYIRRSLGEFSCAKPSCVRLQNAWISDRTLCYLASGKPAVVQHTGPSELLPDAAGLFRVRTVEEASTALDVVARDYDDQSRLARKLAEEQFDARRIATQLVADAVA